MVLTSSFKALITTILVYVALYFTISYFGTINKLPTGLVSYDSAGITSLFVDKPFEGTWNIEKSNSLLKKSYGKVKANFSFLDFDENGKVVLATNSGHLVIFLNLYDSKYSEYSSLFIPIELRIDSLEKFSPMPPSQGLSSSVQFLTKKFYEGTAVETWNFNYTGRVSFNSSIITTDGRSNRKYNSTEFYSNANLLTAVITFPKKFEGQTEQKLWDGEPPSIVCSLSYNEISDPIGGNIFVLMSMIIIFVNIYAVSNIFRKISQDISLAGSFSMMTICWVYVWDIAFIFSTLIMGVLHIDPINTLLVFFFTIAVPLIVDYRFIAYVWRYGDPRDFEGLTANQVKVKHTRMIILMMLFTFFIVKFMISYMFRPWAIFLNSFILVPQIIHNLWTEKERVFEIDFPILFVAIKYCLIVYFRTNADSALGLRPALGSGVFGFCVLMFSIVVLYWQSKWGATEILPSAVYILLNKIKEAEAPKVETAPQIENTPTSTSNFEMEEKQYDMADLCKICLSSLNPDESSESLKQETSNERPSGGRRRARRANPKRIFTTTCGHKFHPECIKTWMGANPNCPECKSSIGPISM
jgi:hypothetical protein